MSSILSYIPNLLVSLSNLSFIYFVKDKPKLNMLLYFPMMASIIYHLAETKHELPGFPIMNKYANLLLNIDRIGAVGSGLYMFSKIYHNPHLLTSKLVLLGSIGFMALAYSEKDTVAKKLFDEKVYVSYTEFTISHIIWHLFAFKALSLVI